MVSSGQRKFRITRDDVAALGPISALRCHVDRRSADACQPHRVTDCFRDVVSQLSGVGDAP